MSKLVNLSETLEQLPISVAGVDRDGDTVILRLRQPTVPQDLDVEVQLSTERAIQVAQELLEVARR